MCISTLAHVIAIVSIKNVKKSPVNMQFNSAAFYFTFTFICNNTYGKDMYGYVLLIMEIDQCMLLKKKPRRQLLTIKSVTLKGVEI